MPIRLESDVERRACKLAEDRGWQALKLVCVGHKGFPDRWFIKPGPVIVIIEFKAPGKRARKLQRYVCAMLAKLGFNVHEEVDNVDEAMRILDAASLSAESNEADAVTVESGAAT